jgi:hypothetical protein
MKNLAILVDVVIDTGVVVKNVIEDKGETTKILGHVLPLVGEAGQLQTIDFSALKGEVDALTDDDVKALVDIVKTKLPQEKKLAEGIDLAIQAEKLVKQVIAFIKA